MNREQKQKANRKRYIYQKYVKLYLKYVKIKNGNIAVIL